MESARAPLTPSPLSTCNSPSVVWNVLTNRATPLAVAPPGLLAQMVCTLVAELLKFTHAESEKELPRLIVPAGARKVDEPLNASALPISPALVKDGIVPLLAVCNVVLSRYGKPLSRR